jgi:alpha-methylacyl-CoA racemase
LAAGPLDGLKVLEFAGLGPAPFTGMMLADAGAEVLRVQRPGGDPSLRDPTHRGRSSLTLDLKRPEAVALCLELVAQADVLIEGFRPGVMERMGLGPEPAQARNPRLIYGRMTGWGQDGPLAGAAGHDINYIALTGALAAMGEPDRPPRPPLNLVGDYGGGAMFLLFGVLAALWERGRSGRGQVVDAAVVDGTAALMSVFSWMRADGLWGGRRGTGLLDGSAPFYRTYRCSDGRFLSVGPLEPQFYALLLEKAGLDSAEFARDTGPGWPALSQRLEALFATRTRDDWCALLEGTDACVAPVLTLDEAPAHPQMAAREVFTTIDGVTQPAPAPRFSRTPGAIEARRSGAELAEVWGVAEGALRAAGAALESDGPGPS